MANSTNGFDFTANVPSIPNHYDPLHPVNVTKIGILFWVIIVLYSMFILGQLILVNVTFWKRRDAYNTIKIRGIVEINAIVLLLQGYLVALFVLYNLSLLTCTAEFWIMNTLFPVGLIFCIIPAFRLANILNKYEKAEETGKWGKGEVVKFSATPTGFVNWFCAKDLYVQTYIWLSVAIVFQVGITAFIWIGSRRFSPFGGFFGEHVDQLTCRRGYEWIPSCLWQVFVFWILGPCFLIKYRHFTDNLHWSLQIKLCIIAGMPGTPLWLLFLYAKFSWIQTVNEWVPPAIWFAPGLITIQLTTLIISVINKNAQQVNPIMKLFKNVTTAKDEAVRRASAAITSAAALLPFHSGVGPDGFRQIPVEMAHVYERQAPFPSAYDTRFNHLFAREREYSVTQANLTDEDRYIKRQRGFHLVTDADIGWGPIEPNTTPFKTALKTQLAQNPGPLLRFAKGRLVAEMVMFEVRVQEMKEKWTGHQMFTLEDSRRHDDWASFYLDCLKIYRAFIKHGADGYVNISYKNADPVKVLFGDEPDGPEATKEDRDEAQKTLAKSEEDNWNAAFDAAHGTGASVSAASGPAAAAAGAAAPSSGPAGGPSPPPAGAGQSLPALQPGRPRRLRTPAARAAAKRLPGLDPEVFDACQKEALTLLMQSQCFEDYVKSRRAVRAAARGE